MNRELLKAHVAALINEAVALRKSNLHDAGRVTGVCNKSLRNYASGNTLPSTRTWERLMSAYCELPDLRPEISTASQDMYHDAAIKALSVRIPHDKYDSLTLHDISPEERTVAVARVFHCHPREVTRYDDISAWVLVRMKQMPASELKQNRIQVLCKLFAEARHAVQQ